MPLVPDDLRLSARVVLCFGDCVVAGVRAWDKILVWSRSEGTRIELEDVRRGVRGVAHDFEGCFPPECLKVLGKVVD